MPKAACSPPMGRGHWQYSTMWIGVAALMGLLFLKMLTLFLCRTSINEKYKLTDYV